MPNDNHDEHGRFASGDGGGSPTVSIGTGSHPGARGTPERAAHHAAVQRAVDDHASVVLGGSARAASPPSLTQAELNAKPNSMGRGHNVVPHGAPYKGVSDAAVRAEMQRLGGRPSAVERDRK